MDTSRPWGIGFASEAVVHEACRAVLPRDGYVVVSDSTNLTYRWGNYLQCADVPEDLRALEDRFDRELPHAAGRYAVAWDDDVACSTTARLVPRFVARGYRVEASVCLVCRPDDVPERPVPTGIAIRPLASERDWSRAVVNQLDCRDLGDDPGHVPLRMDAARRAVDGGRGLWLAAFDDDELVADLGLFWGDGLCRYQAIGTKPSHRGRGIASALVEHAARWAGHEAAGSELAILTGMRSPARRLYERLGFVPVAVHAGALGGV